MAVSFQRPEIPIDVVEEILVYLEVKDLVRYKAVSKLWLASITSPEFIKNHLFHQSRREKIIATSQNTYEEPGEAPLEIVSLSPDGHNPQTCALGWVVGVVGSCNGLLCLLSELDRRLLHIWNPSTRERRRTCYIADPHVKGIGFGYDETTGDYKVVKISSLEKKYSVEVWNLKTHGWRRAHSSFPDHIKEDDYRLNSSLFVGKSVYWFARSKKPRKDPVVVSFDIAEETFSSIEMPDAIVDDPNHNHPLVNFMGSLAMLVYAGWTGRSTLFDVWVLGEDNHFTLKFRIGPFQSEWLCRTGVCIDGRFLLLQRGAQIKYILHDPQSKEDTEVKGTTPRSYRYFEGFNIDYPYWSLVESLVSVKAEEP